MPGWSSKAWPTAFGPVLAAAKAACGLSRGLTVCEESADRSLTKCGVATDSGSGGGVDEPQAAIKAPKNNMTDALAMIFAVLTAPFPACHQAPEFAGARYCSRS